MAFAGNLSWERPVSIQLPKDRELAGLLRGTGLPHEGLINGLSIAADPDSGGSNVVTLTVTPHSQGARGHADAVAADLAELLDRTPAGTPGRDALAGVAAQLGIREISPEPRRPRSLHQRLRPRPGPKPRQRRRPTGEGF